MNSPAPTLAAIAGLTAAAAQQPKMGGNFPKVSRQAWHQLKAGEWVLLRLRAVPAVLLLEVLDNKLGHHEAPSIAVGGANRTMGTVLRRSDIRFIKRYTGPAPSWAAHRPRPSL